MKKKVQYILLFLLGGISFLLGFIIYRNKSRAEETMFAQAETSKTNSIQPSDRSENTVIETKLQSKTDFQSETNFQFETDFQPETDFHAEAEMFIEDGTQFSSIETEDTFNNEDLILDEDICVVENTDYQIPQEKLQQLQRLKQDSRKNYSFYIKDLNSGAVFSYHDTSKMLSESCIKFPYAFYVTRYISKNNPQLYEKKITYSEEYVPSVSDGTGIIQYEPVGSEFCVGELLEYSIRYSDNIAYSMLVDYFGKNDYEKFISSFQAESLSLEEDIWPYISAKDLGRAYEVYYHELGQNTGAEYLWDSLTHSETGIYEEYPSLDVIEFIRDILSCTVAEKYGCTPDGYNHAGIVMREQPYVMILLTENGECNTAAQWHRELITLLDEIVREYQNN